MYAPRAPHSVPLCLGGNPLQSCTNPTIERRGAVSVSPTVEVSNALELPSCRESARGNASARSRTKPSARVAATITRAVAARPSEVG